MYTPVGFFAPQGGGWVTTNLVVYVDPFASTIGGGTASDLSGNGYNATLNRSIAVTGTNDGSGGWQLNATGASAKYLSYAGLSALSFSTGVTIEVFFKVITNTYDSEPFLFGSSNSSIDNFMNIPIRSTASGAASGVIKGFIRGTGNAEFEGTAKVFSGGVSTGWNHIVLASNCNTSHNLYVNGVLDTTNTTNSGDPSTSRLWMSGGPLDGGTIINRGFSNALMGLNRVYSRQLTAAEVLQNYNANKADYGL
jgi:hypothetical protein